MTTPERSRQARPRRRLNPASRDAPSPGSGADLTPEADPESVARAIVLRRLTAAPRTRAQLADDLLERSVPAEVADRVLDRFTEVGLVDDAAYAQAWVRSRQAGRGLARAALRRELRDRGVPEAVVDEAVGEVSADEEQRSAADLVARRLPSTRGLPGERRTNRLLGMLLRRGYPSGLAIAVVREALTAESQEDQPLAFP
jgi:regulatory protein